MKLRDYQNTAVDEIRQSYRNGRRSPMLVLPTGGGKTVIFSYITRAAAERGNSVMILLHRVELVRQTSDKLTQMGVDHGVIHPEYRPEYQKAVQVASVQSLVRRFAHTSQPDLIVIDECHHVRAGQWQKVLSEYPDAKTLGVTATPMRSDGKGLADSFDDIIVGATVRELIDQGFLVEPMVYSVPVADFGGLKKRMGDFDKAQQAEIMDKPKIYGDVVGHYKKLAQGMPAVAFCTTVKHAEQVAQAFRAAGVRSESADGSMSDENRKRVLSGLSDGTVEVLTTCDLISEGTDIPAIGCAILLRRTMSEGLFIQQVGRALRPMAGKSHAVIIDHVGNTRLHGLPDQDREWILTKDKMPGRGRGKNENTERIAECKSCYAVFTPAPECPYCGAPVEVKRKPPEVVDGELELVKEVKRQKRMEIGRAKTIEELRAIAAERGYKSGWVWKQAQLKGLIK
jgi:superfamily II DNA or RNA helicase